MNEKPKRPGRPPKAANSRVGNLTFRIHDSVRAHLARSASITGRTLTEEVEDRVQRSVRVEEQAFGGPQTYDLMLSVAARLRTYERRFGKHWSEIDDERFYRAASRCFREEIEAFQADLFRPLTLDEANRYAEESDEPPFTDEQLAAEGIRSAEDTNPSEWRSQDDWELPPDPADVRVAASATEVVLAKPRRKPRG